MLCWLCYRKAVYFSVRFFITIDQNNNLYNINLAKIAMLYNLNVISRKIRH